MNSLPPSVRANSVLIVALACVTFLGAQRHSGFIIFLTAPPIFLYQLIQLFRHRKSAPLLHAHLVAIAILAIASFVILGVHSHLHDASRAQANQVAQRVEQFQAASGHYPASLSEVGLDSAALRHDLMLSYLPRDNDAMLFYAATFVPFDTWHYSFSAHEWSYVPS
jgi:hypothetical protein